ncbi:MAG: prolyl oligopeptidase family serine peptidase, partial [Planctomycetaceae bacterium]
MRSNHWLMWLVMTNMCLCRGVWAQPAPPGDAAQLGKQLQELEQRVGQLRSAAAESRDRHAHRWVADVAVYSKAVSWILRHAEFYKPNYVQQARAALKTGFARAETLTTGDAPWNLQPGTTIRGYTSRVDGSVQPYALTLPENVDPKSGKRWPLYVKLHGRAGQMNEVNFMARHDGKPLPTGQTWIQLDVFGRTNNAYRWSGETDVFEAIQDVERRFRIDGRRVTLHGFSMGGAGAWHLGMHHPARWSSVGPGAGFVDFYNYQNQKQKRPVYQHRTLGIYDAVDYALNAHNVPVCTYGGELDKQLVASTSMVDAARKLNVPIKLLVGPQMGHKFHPDSFREFMAFHADKSREGRPRASGRQDLRF